jgi:glycosyltransferase involved in cell wall biosynthesis
MSNKPILSVVLATYNEAHNLGRCLESVKSIADEIIVVDGESTDSTRQIARDFGAKIIKTTNKPNFHINKQMALDAAKGDWILQLDADEVVTPQLASEISQVINLTQNKLNRRRLPDKQKRLFERHQQLLFHRDGLNYSSNQDIVAFFIPRLNMFLGRPLRYGGVYPDGVIRLVKKGFAHFPAKDVHEQMRVSGQVSWLVNHLLHFDSPTFYKYIHRANRYTSLTAANLKKDGVKLSITNDIRFLFIKPIFTTAKLYLRHRGYKDGFPGFVFALFSGLHHAIAYMKLGDLYRQHQH